MRIWEASVWASIVSNIKCITQMPHLFLVFGFCVLAVSGCLQPNRLSVTGLLIRRIKSQQFSFKTRIKIKTETWKLQHIKLNIHWSATTLKELVEYCASLPRAAKTAQTHQGMDTRVLWEHPVHSHPRASNAAIQLDAVGPQWYEQGAL